jgi:hypothetical protein
MALTPPPLCGDRGMTGAGRRRARADPAHRCAVSAAYLDRFPLGWPGALSAARSRYAVPASGDVTGERLGTLPFLYAAAFPSRVSVVVLRRLDCQISDLESAVMSSAGRSIVDQRLHALRSPHPLSLRHERKQILIATPRQVPVVAGASPSPVRGGAVCAYAPLRVGDRRGVVAAGAGAVRGPQTRVCGKNGHDSAAQLHVHSSSQATTWGRMAQIRHTCGRYAVRR